MVPRLGNTTLRQLRPEHIEILYQHPLIVGSRRGGPLGAKTVKNLHQIIHSALRDAVDRGLVALNAAETVRAPDPRKRPSSSRRAHSWSGGELRRFLDKTGGNPHSMLFRLTAATGMRRGEALGLRWDHVHFDTGRIEITQAITSVGYRLEFSRLKTKTSRRNITVDTDTMARLAEFRRHQGARLEAERLGHSNPSFTMMTYQHVLPGMQEDAANSFGQLLTRDIGEFDQSPIAA